MKSAAAIVLILSVNCPAAEKKPAPAAADKYEGMALVPAGEFVMGSASSRIANESPPHKVYLDAFYMDKYEVTSARYKAFMKATGRKTPRQFYPDKEGYPAVYMDWFDAQAYCEYYGKTLPTEAQWEKAARGGSAWRYCFGDDKEELGDYAWFWGNSGRKLRPVGKKKPNAYGIYDMHGNVLEWTADWYSSRYYYESPAKNPPGPGKGKSRVVRGGSVYVSAELCRSAARMKSSPYTRYSAKGFRCAAPAPAPRKK